MKFIKDLFWNDEQGLDIPDEITGNMALWIYIAVGRKLWPLVLAYALIYSLDFVTHFFGG